MEKTELLVNIRFPYCPGHCVFCDDRTYGENITDATRYRTALEKEIAAAREDLEEYRITAVHVGGGALSTLGYGSMENFLDKLQRSLPVEPSLWTVEMLPSEMNEMNLAILKHRGISRIALGLMGMTKEELRSLHRPYTINLVENCLQILAREKGLNVSAELVIGIPGQTVDEWKAHLQRLPEVGIGEIRLTRYHDKTKSPREQRVYAEETDWHAYTSAAGEVLLPMGYTSEEKKLVFRKPGHGLSEYSAAAEQISIMGFGVGATTRLDGFSYHNTPRMKDYLEHSDSFEDIAILDKE